MGWTRRQQRKLSGGLGGRVAGVCAESDGIREACRLGTSGSRPLSGESLSRHPSYSQTLLLIRMTCNPICMRHAFAGRLGLSQQANRSLLALAPR